MESLRPSVSARGGWPTAVPSTVRRCRPQHDDPEWQAMIRTRVDAVKAACPLYEVASRFTKLEPPRLTRKSACGLCPLHQERTPSFHVFLRTDTWYCFGCKQSGDVITLVQRHLDLPFFEALEWLERDTLPGQILPGRAPRILRPQDVSAPERSASARHTAAGRAALRLAIDVYAHALWEQPLAQRYLAQRGVPEELAVRGRLGYAVGTQLVAALRAYHIPLQVAFDLGLLCGSLAHPRERFRGRLIVPELRSGIPVWLTGRLIAWDASTSGITQPPKYLALAGERVLGGAMMVANQSWAVVVEGPFDWLAALKWRVPVCYVGGQVGGHAVPRELTSWLANAQRIYLALDPDQAGAQLRDLLISLFAGRAWSVELPIGHDPGALGTRADGEARFVAALAAARPPATRSPV